MRALCGGGEWHTSAQANSPASMGHLEAGRDKLAGTARAATTATVQTAALAVAGVTSKRFFAFFRAELPRPGGFLHAMCARCPRVDAAEWEHMPASGFYKNGLPSVATIRGLPHAPDQDVAVRVTAVHADGSLHAAPHVRRPLPDRNGMQVEYTITAYAAVRVVVALRLRGVQLEMEFKPVPSLSRAWQERTPYHSVPVYATDRYTVVEEEGAFRLTRGAARPAVLRRRHFDISIRTDTLNGSLWLINKCLAHLWRLNVMDWTLEDVQPQRSPFLCQEHVVGTAHVYFVHGVLHVMNRTTGSVHRIDSMPNFWPMGASVSPDGTRIVSMRDRTVAELELASAKLRTTDVADVLPCARVYDVFFCPNGDLAAVGMADAVGIMGRHVGVVAVRKPDGTWYEIEMPAMFIVHMFVEALSVVHGRVVCFPSWATDAMIYLE